MCASLPPLGAPVLPQQPTVTEGLDPSPCKPTALPIHTRNPDVEPDCPKESYCTVQPTVHTYVCSFNSRMRLACKGSVSGQPPSVNSDALTQGMLVRGATWLPPAPRQWFAGLTPQTACLLPQLCSVVLRSASSNRPAGQATQVRLGKCEAIQGLAGTHRACIKAR